MNSQSHTCNYNEYELSQCSTHLNSLVNFIEVNKNIKKRKEIFDKVNNFDQFSRQYFYYWKNPIILIYLSRINTYKQHINEFNIICENFNNTETSLEKVFGDLLSDLIFDIKGFIEILKDVIKTCGDKIYEK